MKNIHQFITLGLFAAFALSGCKKKTLQTENGEVDATPETPTEELFVDCTLDNVDDDEVNCRCNPDEPTRYRAADPCCYPDRSDMNPDQKCLVNWTGTGITEICPFGVVDRTVRPGTIVGFPTFDNLEERADLGCELESGSYPEEDTGTGGSGGGSTGTGGGGSNPPPVGSACTGTTEGSGTLLGGNGIGVSIAEENGKNSARIDEVLDLVVTYTNQTATILNGPFVECPVSVRISGCTDESIELPIPQTWAATETDSIDRTVTIEESENCVFTTVNTKDDREILTIRVTD